MSDLYILYIQKAAAHMSRVNILNVFQKGLWPNEDLGLSRGAEPLPMMWRLCELYFSGNTTFSNASQKETRLDLAMSPGFLGTKPMTRKWVTKQIADRRIINKVAVFRTMGKKNHRKSYIKELGLQGQLQMNGELIDHADHRKMLFLYVSHVRRPGFSSNYDSLDLELFLSSHNDAVKAIALGSSNVSSTTYSGNPGLYGYGKDEADIILFQDDNLANLLLEMRNIPGLFLTKSMYTCASDTLNDIFLNTIDALF